LYDILRQVPKDYLHGTFGLVFSVSTEHKRPNFRPKVNKQTTFLFNKLLLILPHYTPSIMPHKKRFTKGTAKTEASRVSKSGRQQIPPAIRSAATALSEISGNSLLSIGKSLDLKPNTVHRIVKDAKKKAEDNNQKLLDQRNFEDASRSDRPYALFVEKVNSLCDYVVETRENRNKTAKKHITELNLSISESTFAQYMYDRDYCWDRA